METNNNKGVFRCLTPNEIGKAVATFRKASGMKQITLAYEAGRIQERTIQRLERGEQVSEDTLRKVAKALRIDESSFIGPRYVPTEEEALENATKFLSEVQIIDAKELITAQDCGTLFTAHAYLVDDTNVAHMHGAEIAVFKDQLQDWGDIYESISHTERFRACESVLENVRAIAAAGHRLLYAVYETEDKFRVSTVVILPKGDDALNQLKQLIVPKNFMSMIR
jgi:transcriptional regulator with XRE-family HTH domain